MASTDEFEILVLGCEDYDPHDDNVDVEVKFRNGSRFTGTFFTLKNLATLFEKNSHTGECGGGSYFWATEMILVRRIDQTTMELAVRELLKDGEFDSAFTCVPDEAQLEIERTKSAGRV